MTPSVDVLGLGSPLVDFILTVSDSFLSEVIGDAHVGGADLIPHHSLVAILDRYQKEPVMAMGGSISNSLRALTHLGAQCAFIGKVGADALGKQYMETLRELGIHSHLIPSEHPTGQVVSLVTPDGQRTMRTHLGAAATLQKEELSPHQFEKASLFFLEGHRLFDLPVAKQAIAYAKAKGLKIALDLASFEVVNNFKEELFEILRHDVDIVFGNEDEARAMTGEGEEETCRYLGEMVETAIVLIGERGCWVSHRGNVAHHSAFPVKAVDTTGAGDAFAAGFLYAYLQDHSMDVCAIYGALLGRAVVQVLGAEIPQEAWKEIHAELRVKVP